jgi:hypothetical protein
LPHLPTTRKPRLSQPRSETPLRLEGADLWTFLGLQIEIQERQLLLQASQQKLEIFGQIQKEKLGFTDEEILDPAGFVVSLQELQDRIRTASSGRSGSASPDQESRNTG